MEDYERILLQPPCCVDAHYGRQWRTADVWGDDCDEHARPTEYVRNDLFEAAQARIAALEAELARAREAAHNLREAFRLFPEANDTLTRAELRAAKGNWRSLIDQQSNAINAALKAAQP